MLEALLGDKLKELKDVLMNQSGFSQKEADDFVPAAAKDFLGTFQEKKDEVNLNNLQATAVKLLESFDVDSLATKVGIPADQARAGIAAILPILISLAEQHKDKLEMLNSFMGSSLGGMLGGFFKR
ncbi:MAG TPA: hypothetical protein DHW71_01910 [Gammaproteobacteria bacterium]|nr:hypothetical protein [Gammaproteobacteria bacterium]MBK83388.1 hypothetical protein [Gammaproteobacteria bacterium]MEC8011030.1 hypothetical protein [Pseudomonadota bacterium]HBF08078.1 hypothetical protein [Gammaproteobacteria bacterium]HCK91709.1 hypothetical protein [Gammaproteobacteria bacterium]|tara:strand:+ start:880 stop:1257 length:378 start_codon:yes stop_codon:yes gene_type:complete